LKSRPNDRKTQKATTAGQLRWQVTRNHVYPVNDLREHSLTKCWCRPIEDEGIVIHNSLDARELYERGERKLS
jgi:hypothetical protein